MLIHIKRYFEIVIKAEFSSWESRVLLMFTMTFLFWVFLPFFLKKQDIVLPRLALNLWSYFPNLLSARLVGVSFPALVPV